METHIGRAVLIYVPDEGAHMDTGRTLIDFLHHRFWLRDLVRISRITIVFAALAVELQSANAFDEKHLQAVVTLQECNRCDLSGAFLEKLKLRDMELAGANLSEALLAKADFTFSNMKGANLRGADLIEANLYSVYLNKADLTNANLKDASLHGASFVLANLTGANFEGAWGGAKADFTLAKFCKTTWLDGTIKNKDC